MPSYTAYKRQVMDADDNITWITMKGNHIPIKEGQTKEEAVKEFLAKKESKKDYKIAHKDKSGNTTVIAEVTHHEIGGKGEGSAKHGSGEYKAKAKKDPFATKTKENHKNEIINGQTHFTYTDPDGLNFRVTESSNDPGWKSSNLPTESFKSKEEAITASKERLKSDKLKYGDFNNKRNKEYMFNVYKKGFAESEPEMGDPHEAQRLSGIEKPKTEKHKDLRSAFGKHYEDLYKNHDKDDAAYNLLNEWDEHIKDPKFKKAVQEFVQERGDFISSDREVKAFMLAAKETGLIKDKPAPKKSDSALVNAVAKALNKSTAEAESEIEGAAQYIKDLMKSNDLRNGDVEETLRGLGVEPDYAEEFMQWTSTQKKKKTLSDVFEKYKSTSINNNAEWNANYEKMQKAINKEYKVENVQNWTAEREGIRFGGSDYGDYGTNSTVKVSKNLKDLLLSLPEHKQKDVIGFIRVDSGRPYSSEHIDPYEFMKALKNGKEDNGETTVNIKTITHGWFDD